MNEKQAITPLATWMALPHIAAKLKNLAGAVGTGIESVGIGAGKGLGNLSDKLLSRSPTLPMSMESPIHRFAQRNIIEPIGEHPKAVGTGILGAGALGVGGLGALAASKVLGSKKEEKKEEKTEEKKANTLSDAALAMSGPALFGLGGAGISALTGGSPGVGAATGIGANIGGSVGGLAGLAATPILQTLAMRYKMPWLYNAAAFAPAAGLFGGLGLGGLRGHRVGKYLFEPEEKTAKDMPHFTAQDRPEKVKEIYTALKRDHPEMPAEVKARIASRKGKKSPESRKSPEQGGPDYKAPLDYKYSDGKYKAASFALSKQGLPSEFNTRSGSSVTESRNLLDHFDRL